MVVLLKPVGERARVVLMQQHNQSVAADICLPLCQVQRYSLPLNGVVRQTSHNVTMHLEWRPMTNHVIPQSNANEITVNVDQLDRLFHDSDFHLTTFFIMKVGFTELENVH